MNLVSTRYAFTSAYLKGEEARIITSEHVNGMFQRASTIPETLDIIRDTDIGEYLTEQTIKTFDDAEPCLWKYLGACIERLERFKLPSDMAQMLEVYDEKYDVMNIKILLRCITVHGLCGTVPLGRLHGQGLMGALLKADSLEVLSEGLTQSGLGHYTPCLEDLREKDIRATIECELCLDRHYLNRMRAALGTMDDGDILTKAFGIMIDLANLQGIIRSAMAERQGLAGDFILEGGHMLTEELLREAASLKMNEIAGRLDHTEYHQLLQEIARTYDKENAMPVIDRIMERHKYRLLRGILSARALSPCNLLWYLIVKEREIRNLRIVMKSIADGITASDIRDYLVMAA